MHSKLILTFCSTLLFTLTLSGMKLESPLALAPNPFEIDAYALVEQGETRAVEELLTREWIGLDEQRESDGQTIAHIAATKNNVNLIQFLLDREANFRVQDQDDNTPLHCALIAGSFATALTIINAQLKDSTTSILDLSRENRECKTVLDCAISYQIQHYRRQRAQLGKDGDCLCASIWFDGERKAIRFKQNDTNHLLFRIRLGSAKEWCVEHDNHRYCLIIPREVSVKCWYRSTAAQITRYQRKFWAYVNPFELVDIIGKLKWLTRQPQIVVTTEGQALEGPSEPSEAMEKPVTPTPMDGDPAADEAAFNELRSSLADRLAALYEDAQCEKAACTTIHGVFVGPILDDSDDAL